MQNITQNPPAHSVEYTPMLQLLELTRERFGVWVVEVVREPVVHHVQGEG